MKSYRVPILFLGFLLFLALLGHFWFWGNVYLSRPIYSGEVKIQNFPGSAKVFRDQNGVPHIEADSSKAAYTALGYTMASDRLFQMELQRRVGQGQLSEIFGSALLESDLFLRTLLLRKSAEDYLKSNSKLAPEAWIELDAFLDGINAFIAEDRLPIEFKILGFKPRKFERIDSIAFLYYMGFSFAEGIKSDSLFSILESQLTGRLVRELFPRYDFEPNASILESQPGAKLTAKLEPKGLNLNEKVLPFLVAMDDLKIPIPPLLGSNSWVLSGKRTESGGAILANDPHIGLSNPGTWYEAHVKFPGYETYGYFLSILPFPLVGHNREKAWGLTMLEQDDVNLYAESIRGEKVVFKNVEVPLVFQEELIPQKDGSTKSATIRITPHGPVITDFVKGYSGRPLSLFWVNHQNINPLVEVLFLLGRANSLKEMEDVGGLVIAPGLNISYADKNGNIGYYAIGRFPILKGNVRKILEGSTGESEVTGYLPFSANPRLINPSNGIIVTANNLVTSKPLPAVGIPEGNWHPPDRFLRIRSLLETKEKWSTEDLSKMQFDTYSSFAPEFLKIVLPILGERSHSGEKAAISLLKEWDFQNDRKSKGALVYQVLFAELHKAIYLDELGEEKYKLYGDFADSWISFRYMMRHPESLFWDDIATVGTKETQANRIELAFQNTVRFLEKEISSSPSLWVWEKLYRIKHPHPLGKIPLLGKIFDLGPFPATGGPEVINNLKYKIVAGDFTATAGPSKRRVIDFGNLNHSKTQTPLGNSGHLGSPFYGNLIEDYNSGKARSILFEANDYQSTEYQMTFGAK